MSWAFPHLFNVRDSSVHTGPFGLEWMSDAAIMFTANYIAFFSPLQTLLEALTVAITGKHLPLSCSLFIPVRGENADFYCL